jgi:hypothetical protein
MGISPMVEELRDVALYKLYAKVCVIRFIYVLFKKVKVNMRIFFKKSCLLHSCISLSGSRTQLSRGRRWPLLHDRRVY